MEVLTDQINQMVYHLERAEIVLYPTDTIWGIGCDATNTASIKRIFDIKCRSFSKTMIVLVDSFQMLQEYVEYVPDFLMEYLTLNEEPTSVIYTYKQGLSSLLVREDKTVAVRIVQDDFCRKVIHRFGRPIVSTSANISGESNPKSFSEIDKSLIAQVDFAVHYRRDEKSAGIPSRLIDVSDGKIIFLR